MNHTAPSIRGNALATKSEFVGKKGNVPVIHVHKVCKSKKEEEKTVSVFTECKIQLCTLLYQKSGRYHIAQTYQAQMIDIRGRTEMTCNFAICIDVILERMPVHIVPV